MSKLKILHCFGALEAFTAEQLPHRLAKLGTNLEHLMVGVAQDDWQSAIGKFKPPPVAFLDNFPRLAGKPTPGRLLGLANAIKPFDLVLTYGWGAIDVAMAHTLFGEALGLPPLVHHETELTGEEKRLSKRRSWYRRIALGRAAGLVVPSERLEEAALVAWQQPLGRVKHFAPCVEFMPRGKPPKPDAVRGVIKREGEQWIGARLTKAGDVATYRNLVAALADLPGQWHLVVLANGIDTDELAAQAEAKDVAHRIHFASLGNGLSTVMGLFDIWTSLTEGMEAQRGALVAMAQGRVVLAGKDGDTAALLSAENRANSADALTPKVLSQALSSLVQDDAKRDLIGEGNLRHAQQNHDQLQALDRYRRLYASAMKSEIKA